MPPNPAPQNPLPRSRCKYLRNSLRQNLAQLEANWPHTTKPANTEPATINRNKQLQTTSNQKPSNQKPPNQKPPNQKPPNQNPPKVCHGWVDIKVGGEWAGWLKASIYTFFSLCPKESADMVARHGMSCRLAWSRRQNLTTCRDNIPDISKTCLHVGGRHVVWGCPAT